MSGKTTGIINAVIMLDITANVVIVLRLPPNFTVTTVDAAAVGHTTHARILSHRIFSFCSVAMYFIYNVINSTSSN